ncbi:MAG: LysM peptidoglycan-binding domain-containing protein [Clostridiales bacterium]|nr:LysM peptidoglycan-binding domain-containing protein [Clostridiales bacterium]
MRKFKSLLCAALLFLLLVSMTVPAMAYEGSSSSLYTMHINDLQVGVIKFPARALQIYDSVEKAQKAGFDEEVFIDSRIHFKEAKPGSTELTDEKTLAKAIGNAIDIRVHAYSVNIDGTKILNVKTMEDGQKLIDDIKAPYIPDPNEEGGQLEAITFKQDIDFTEDIVSVKDIVSPEEALRIILHGREELKDYEVQEGDNLWVIAHENGLEESDLMLSNPDLTSDIIHPGQVIKIGRQERLLSVITTEKIHYSEEIPFESETRQDSSLLRGNTKVVQQGEKGRKDITALVTKEDGQEVSREITEEKVSKEPVKHIVANGTKAPPRPKPAPKPKTSTKPKSSGSSGGSSNTSTSRASGSGSDVVAYAKRFNGYRYVFGTSGPNTFDCSGFTKYVYGHFGVSLPHSSASQRSVGKAVSRSELKAGDILCFSGHVGLYIGGGQFIHASNRKDGVKISNLDSYGKRLITARRIFY